MHVVGTSSTCQTVNSRPEPAFPPTSSPSSSPRYHLMPSEHINLCSVADSPQDQPAQLKVCSSCHSVVDPTSSVFIPEADSIVCPGCREHVLAALASLIVPDTRGACSDVDGAFGRQSMLDGALPIPNTRHLSDLRPFDQDSEMASPVSVESDHSYRSNLIFPPTYTAVKRLPLSIQTTPNPSSTPVRTSVVSQSSTDVLRRQGHSSSYPDPLTDITRIRVRSRGHQCLYPGATFQGTQKSGRNSYTVNVTIVVRLLFPSMIQALQQQRRTWILLHPSFVVTFAYKT